MEDASAGRSRLCDRKVALNGWVVLGQHFHDGITYGRGIGEICGSGERSSAHDPAY